VSVLCVLSYSCVYVYPVFMQGAPEAPDGF